MSTVVNADVFKQIEEQWDLVERYSRKCRDKLDGLCCLNNRY